jgi:peptide/nickel transport system substrate-binding protein
MRRRLLALAGALALLAAGCARDEPATQDQAAEGPVKGGTLVVALSADPGHLNPAITTSGGTHAAAELLYNGLVSLDEQGRPAPELAESWTVEQNGLLYRFRLRDGVRWHDGQPFTSADVKYTFEEALLKLHGRTRASVQPNLAAIEVPDERTVVFRFSTPYAPLLQQLDVTEAPIIPKHVYEGSDPNASPANSRPIGTGPFKFVSYTKGSEIRLARNSDYFRAPLPHLDEVVMRVIPDQATRILALERGEVDWISFSSGAPDLARLERNDAVELVRTQWNPGGSNCIMTLSFNVDRPVLRDVRVRQALFHALDRRQFLDQVLFREGRVAEAPISSGIPWAHARGLALPAFDRARAEQLLESAGWRRQGDGTRLSQSVPDVPDGTQLAIDFLHFPEFAKYGELTRQQLGAVGVEVTQRPLEPAVFPGPVFRDRNFDTAIISYCNGSDPEIGVRRMYHSSQIGSAPFTNAAGYRNAEVDALFDRASREIDQRQRGTLYRQIQEIVVREVPYAWVVEAVGVRAHSAACRGFKFQTGLFAEAAYCRR